MASGTFAGRNALLLASFVFVLISFSDSQTFGDAEVSTLHSIQVNPHTCILSFSTSSDPVPVCWSFLHVAIGNTWGVALGFKMSHTV